MQLIPSTNLNQSNSDSATTIVAKHFKGQVVDSEQTVPALGVMPSGSFIVCGECSDGGGGSSGQCT